MNLNMSLLRLPDCLALPSVLRYFSISVIACPAPLQLPLASGAEPDIARRAGAKRAQEDTTLARKSQHFTFVSREDAILPHGSITWTDLTDLNRDAQTAGRSRERCFA